MSIYAVGGLEEENEVKTALEPMLDVVHVDKLDPEAARVVKATASAASSPLAEIQKLPLGGPSSIMNQFDTPLTGRVTETKTEDPNLALEAVMLCIAKEGQTNQKLNNHINAVREHQKTIDILLDLSAELSAMKKAGKTELSETAKNHLASLKEKSIDIWKSEDKGITKEQISELSSKCGDEIANLRSKVQIIFTTDIKTSADANAAMLEAMRGIMKDNSRFMEKLTRAQTGR